MRHGISAGPLPNIGLPFAAEIARACADCSYNGVSTFSPLVAYAVKVNETVDSTDPAEMQEGTYPGSDYLALPDGSGPDPNNPAGHGLFQLTSSWPANWADPYANTLYALENPGFLMDAEQYWAAQGLTGTALVKLIAASFNAGINGAARGHNAGNADLYTTAKDGVGYGARAAAHYEALLAGQSPFS